MSRLSSSANSESFSQLSSDDTPTRRSFIRRSLRMPSFQRRSLLVAGAAPAAGSTASGSLSSSLLDNGSMYSFPLTGKSASSKGSGCKNQGILLKSRSSNGLILLVQEGCILTDTNEFRLPGSGIVIKLNQVTNIHGHEDKILTVQVILIEPAKDVLMVRVSTCNDLQTASLCKLSSDSKSLILELKPCRKIDLDGEGTIYRSYIFSLDVVNNPWKEAFQKITVPASQLSDVVIKVNDKEIHTMKQYLAKSPILEDRMGQQQDTCILEINNYSFPVVQEMVRFLMHGYCCLWETHRDELVSMAQEFEIHGIRMLADQKDNLLL